MKHPEGSVFCNKCRTDAVIVDGTYRCDCDIRRVARIDSDEANRIRQVVEFARGRHAVCDRCHQEPVAQLVSCSVGCAHAQCSGCARQTKLEAVDEQSYDNMVAARRSSSHEVVEKETVVEEYDTDEAFLSSLDDDDYYDDDDYDDD